MKYTIRELSSNEYKILEDFLYEAIFLPEGVDSPSRDIIKQPELQLYISEFGKEMMRQMLVVLQEKGYRKASLAVQQANYAVRMYQRVGFEIVDKNEEEYIMVCNLK